MSENTAAPPPPPQGLKELLQRFVRYFPRKKPTVRESVFGCLALIICILFVWMLFDKWAGGKVEGKTLEERITKMAKTFKNLEQIEITPQVDGGFAVHVKWKVESAWGSTESLRNSAFMDMRRFLAELRKDPEFSQVVRYWFDPQVDVVDLYGAKSVVPAATINIPGEAVGRIHWDNFNWSMLKQLAESEGFVNWSLAMRK
jgi:hypothetical protein